MCLAVPARVTALLPDGMAKVSLDGVLKEVSLAFVDEVAVGDYVVIHVGYALAKVDAREAEETLSLLREAARA
ncbi:HypC/HybG/HupF family hydrogenase formation chaperone [Xanthobacteraceae bacterium Astr-EGSB]|uniref:HypC/HybG/HupF family hydrogenase formation chaperone n=1 Tax=Astrobacterium formosum TaxID=3069710 RepID=UPI0027B1EAC5|nr:HypC/HybG/HupF family hydrogenase formation chaperone [Xanthobacteraceae bacterium Astr-EGSB]